MTRAACVAFLALTACSTGPVVCAGAAPSVMLVEGILSVFYPLNRSIPAGGYSVLIQGVIGAPDAKLHADLIYRPSGGPDTTIAGLDGISQPPSFHLQPWIQGTICGDAITPNPGDGLVLAISYSGSQSASVIETNLTTP